MLGIYTGIFLLLLITVLTCAVYSCGSVRRGLSRAGAGGQAGPGVVMWGEGEEGRASLIGPWVALPLVDTASNSHLLPPTAVP